MALCPLGSQAGCFTTRDSSLCFPHFSSYRHLMARGQDQLPWETPSPIPHSFCWNVMNAVILRINGNAGGNAGMTGESLAPASFPGLQEWSRQSKGQTKIHQPGKTVGIPLNSVSLSLCSEPSHFPGTGASPWSKFSTHQFLKPPTDPLPWDPSRIPDQTKSIPHPTWPLLAAAPSPGCAEGLYGPVPPPTSRRDAGKEIFPWPRGSPTSPIGKGSGSFFSSERAFAGKGLVSQGLEPNPWGPKPRGLGMG